ncbi:Nuclear valosin-containing protein-like [Orchesella cincta]|uniref:Nuclear valosin-containing protein-like n=1 Tax=Orchesella cincta TaxID=48709 RepID=A0A1D2NAJ0_ORCCI|nr:Nuclear valosin-containing protein-like [Orchesella cincta]
MMNRGFRGGGVDRAMRGGGVTSPSLMTLVEQYLVENSHLSYIDLEQMGKAIRAKSYRFNRMKTAVFRNYLKQAYQLYCQNSNEMSGRDIQLDEDDLSDTTLRQMEGYPTESDDDSVCAIEDEITHSVEKTIIEKDTGVNQMKNLYKSNSNAAQSSSTITQPQENQGGTGEAKASTSTAKKTNGNTISRLININLTPKDDSVSEGSSTDLSSKSVDKDAPDANKATANQGNCPDEDSGSDLEIIEEMPSFNSIAGPANNGFGVISHSAVDTPGAISMSAQVLQGANNIFCLSPTQVQLASTFVKAKPSGSNTTRPPPTETPRNDGNTAGSSKKFEPANRGVKRKPASKSGDEISSAINESLSSKRAKKEVAVIRETGYKLKDFAGSEKLVEEVCKLLMHLKHPEIYQTLGVTPPRGFLLHGPPGTGKTLLANAIAGELQMPMLKVAGTEIVSGISGESESNIRELFNQALAVAPCIIFIDEIDSVTPRRENANKEMERRIVAQLLSCIDDLTNKEKGNQVVLIGATNRIEAIDTALRRAGRFDREICLGIPDESSREKILAIICRDLKMEKDLQLHALARLTPGYVGADIQALVREAAVQAVNRKLQSTELPSQKEQLADGYDDTIKMEVVVEETGEVPVEKTDSAKENTEPEQGTSKGTAASEAEKSEEPLVDSSPLRWIKESSPLTTKDLQDLFVIMNDFEIALKVVQPSSKREGFATVPDVTWDDIGALGSIRDELEVSILGPVKHAAAFKKLGLNTPAGVLLCGPPGCGKTLLAKAVANEAGINFISVKGPELINMYVGESERAVRQCFLRARNSSPCVIFFDELDALCPRRSDVADSGSGGRIVNQLLTEMDGMESRQGVFVMGATNRPDIIDPAVLRPGRLDKILFVNLPTSQDRFEILKTITKNGTKPLLDKDVNLENIASSKDCDNYTGADLAALVREASIAAFRELILHPQAEPCAVGDLKVYDRHFTVAFSKTKPSVGFEDRAKYKAMETKYSSIH